jgi:L-aspartate oxidase
MDQNDFHDVLIVGGGAAGLTLALHLAPHARITLLAKSALQESSTYHAQGGISAALDDEDDFDSHVADTLNSGAGLCDEAAVRYTIEQAPAMIRWLEELGVPFTREETEDGVGPYHLTREGGHSHRRVIHAADATGKALHSTLLSHVLKNPNIKILENRIAIDLITGSKLGLGNPGCLGLYALNLDNSHVECLRARFVVLATGGANKAYLYSTNPDGSTGDGIAMAWRAGCRISNMEFMQFHPTCLYHPQAKSFLLSEALRGEGAHLLLPDGQRFMHRFDPRGELAPRDITARAIDHEMKRLGLDCVYLDISHKSPEFIRRHFPNIHAKALSFGFDLGKQPVPVVPAAHYTCGGILTDLHGRTDIPGLYAIGETACTGLHGANRIASNSLLECLVFGRAAARDIVTLLGDTPAPPALPAWDESRVTDSDEEVVVAHNWHELRQTMWNYVGIARTNKRLQRAESRIKLLMREINEYYRNFKVTNDLLELRNLATVADLIVRSARQRLESRGLHYTLDYPETLGVTQPTILSPNPAMPQADQGNLAARQSMAPLDIE